MFVSLCVSFPLTKLASNNLPPFGLLDFAVVTGISDPSLESLRLEALVAKLRADMDPARLSATAVCKTLRDRQRPLGRGTSTPSEQHGRCEWQHSAPAR